MAIIIKTLCLCLLLVLLPAASASEFLFSQSTDNQEAVASSAEHRIADGWPVQLTNNIEQRLEKGKVLSLPLPGNRYIDSIVKEALPGRGLLAIAGITETRIATLKTGQGNVEIYLSNGKIQGILVLDMENHQAYKIQFDASGKGLLQEQDANQYYCVSYPQPLLPAESALATGEAAPTPDLYTLQQLQSNPGSPNVLYINYWGGTYSGEAWNEGNPIDYTAFSQDSDHDNFSDNERHDMWLAWAEVAEDYAPFNVNVTTDASVYAATQPNQRVQIVATTTCDWYESCSAGGVAYVSVFSNAPEIYRTGWAWNRSAGTLGMTISHESGHQMGLYHDGNAGSEYDSGHGDWGPIMGGPFGKPYVQWSKGEYPDADNTENDLLIIAESLGANTDDAGDSVASATPLSLPVTGFTGLLRPEGLDQDIDVYSFSIASTKRVHLEIGPPLGILGEHMGTSLSLKARLLDASGATLTSLLPSSPPSSNILNETLQLSAGQYSLVLQASSYDSDWSTGFGEYANGGYYSITIKPELGPDLATNAQASSSPTVLSAGQNIGMISTILNQGDSSAAGSTLRYFIADHSAVTPNDTEATETNPVQPLSPQESTQLSQPILMSDGMTPGHYWVSSCVDPVTDEQQTTNNCSPSIEIIIANGVCEASAEISIEGQSLSGFEYRKSGASITFSNSQLAGELYLESPLIQLGIPGTALSVGTGSILSVKSSMPDCQ